MNTCGFRLLLAISVTLLVTGGTRGLGEELRNWAQLEKSLTIWANAQEEEALLWSVLQKSPEVHEWRKRVREDVPLCYEMMSQSEHVFVPLVGFHLLREQHPQESVRGALHCLLARTDKGSLLPFGEVFTSLSKAEASDDNLHAFDIVAKTRLWKVDGVTALIVDNLPEEFLVTWLEQKDEAVPLSAEAYVVESLITHPDVPLEVRERLQNRLESYADIPGVPRFEFLQHTNRRDRKFQDTFILMLEDDTFSISLLKHLVEIHSSYVTKHNLLDKADIPKERLDALR